MYEVLSVILIIFGILQIILFFKIWGMTNNTNKICEMISKRDKIQLMSAEKLVLLEKYDEAFEALKISFISDIVDIYYKTDFQSEYKSQYDIYVNFYKNKFNAVGKTFDFEKYDTLSKIKNQIWKSEL